MSTTKTFAKGDRVVFRENYSSMCAVPGDTGVVLRVTTYGATPLVTVRLDKDGHSGGAYAYRLDPAPTFADDARVVVQPGAFFHDRYSGERKESVTAKGYVGETVTVICTLDNQYGDVRVEGAYGVRFTISPACLVEAPAAPTFAPGDRVVIQPGAYYHDAYGYRLTSVTADSRVGETVAVVGYFPGTPADLRVEDKYGVRFALAPECVTAAPPPFAKGDRVRVTDTATFTRFDGSVIDSLYRGKTGTYGGLASQGRGMARVDLDDVYGAVCVDHSGLVLVHPEPEPLVAPVGARVIVTSPVYTHGGETYTDHAAAVGDLGVIDDEPDSDGDYRVTLDNGNQARISALGLVLAPEPEAPTYAVGDLIRVVSEAPTLYVYGSRTDTTESAVETGEVYRVRRIHEDGDLLAEDPDTSSTVGYVSPEHVEPYVAPAITAPFGGARTIYASTARQSGKSPFSKRLSLGTSYAEWASTPTGESRLCPLPADPEPTAAERRADALEDAIDLLGEGRTVEEYAMAARFILGEEG